MRIVELSLLTLLAVPTFSAAGDSATVKSDPATFKIEVSPAAVDRGGEFKVRLTLTPATGIKINKYPKIKLQFPAPGAIEAAAEAAVGNSAPPPPDHLEDNYFHGIDPVEVTMKLSPGAKPGPIELDGKLSYFYCVASSGYCAPAKSPVKVAVTAR